MSIAPPGRLAILVAAITVAGLGSAPRASAADRYWTCAAQYFDVTSCWGALPGPLDNAWFTSGGSQTVQWDNVVLTNWDNTFPTSPVTNANLNIVNTAVNFQSAAASYTSDAYRTYNITGNVAINTGSLSFNPSVASNPNLIMTVGNTITVSNNGSMDTTGGAVVRSSGGLNLQSGGDAFTYWGAVDSAGVLFATNMMSVNGAQVGGTGSLWNMGTLIVGRNSVGSLGITAGGTVNAGVNGFVGEFVGSSGAITVGGAGATLQVGAGGLYLGGNNVSSGGPGILVVNAGGLASIGGELRLWNGSSSINTTGGGQVHAGTLTIQGGADVDSTFGATGTDYGYGGQVRAASTATVTGAGSTWDMTYLYQLGGTGTANVNAGGVLTATSISIVGYYAGANQQLNVNAGTATLATSDSTYVGYGFNGGAAQGAVNVTNGGALTTGTTYLGYNSAGTGLATVGGGTGSSTWNASALRVGGSTSTSNATGTLTVNNGGVVNVSGQMDVWGANGSVNATAGGRVNAGTLTIQSGADVDSIFGTIGTDYGNSGQVRVASTATVTGAGSTWEMFNLYQLGGTGTVDVNAGGVLTATSVSIVGYDAGANQRLNIDAGTATLATSGFTYVGYGASGAAQGAVNVTNGGMLTTGFAYLGYNSAGTGLATVGGGSGTSTWNASALRVGGLNSAANATGTLTVNSGGVVNVSGQMDVWGADGSVNTTAGGRVDANTLTIQSGADVDSTVGAIGTDFGFVAGQVRAASTATVTGAGSTWDMEYLNQIGGTGTVNATAGGALTATVTAYVGYQAGANQQLNINAASATLATSDFTYVGLGNLGAAQGAVNVTNGGMLTTGFAYLGYNSAGTGLATVGGGAGTSTWNASAIAVGGVNSTTNATGTLTVNSGGLVNVSGQMDVWGANGSVNTTAGGRVNANTLIIQSGADVDSAVGAIGADFGDPGQVRAASAATVTGVGSTWDMVNLYQAGGTGILNVTAGGTLTASTVAYVGYNAGDNQQLNINAASATLGSMNGTFVGYGLLGGAAQGVVNVTNGGTLTTGIAHLGYFPTGTGLATVGGGAGTSTWNASALRVGGLNSAANATGTLAVNSGGVVNVSGQMDVWGANGSVNTTGGGRVTANTLNIVSGADVDSAVGAIGTDNGNVGQVRAASTATVTGAGSTWDMAQLLQLGGTGTLNVTAGGALTATTDARIGYNVGANQQLNINAASAMLAPSWFTYVGFGNGGAAQGAVNVTNGGTLTTGIAHLGFFSTGTGLATVGGGAGTSTWNASAIRVGGAGSTSNATGTLTVNTGGVVTVSGQMDVWGNNGSVNLAGGTLMAATLSNLGTIQFTASSLLDGALDNQDQVNVAAGVTATFGGTVDNTGLVDLGAGSTAIFGALVSGDGDFTGTGKAVFEGGFRPGNSPGLVSFGGDVELDSGNTLTMELGGLARGTGHDALDVAGTITLAGIFEIVLYGGFDAPLFSTYDLIRAESISGLFSSYLLPGDPQNWQVEFLADAEGSTDILRLTVVPVPAAAWLFGGAVGVLGLVRRRQLAKRP